MRPSFDIDALRAVVAGLDLGSFAKAASKLGRSQSALSMQLPKLEQQAGKQLFRRSGRGLMTTEAGDVLVAYARRIIALNDEAAASLGSLAADAAVRVGLPQDFVEEVVPETLTSFAQARPEVYMELRAGRNYQIEEVVRSGRLALQLQFSSEVSAASVGLVSSPPERPCEDMVDRDAPLSELDSDATDFLDRPADQERCLVRRRRVFLSAGSALAR